jgi:predicted adenine nucleotide alpha hydrolase (AANH) superfamily ATPase
LPGTSGLLTPFGKMDGLYFDDSMEPDDEVFRLRNDIEELAEKKGVTYIKLNFENKEDFYKSMNVFRNFANNQIKAYAISSEKDNTLVITKETLGETIEEHE